MLVGRWQWMLSCLNSLWRLIFVYQCLCFMHTAFLQFSRSLATFPHTICRVCGSEENEKQLRIKFFCWLFLTVTPISICCVCECLSFVLCLESSGRGGSRETLGNKPMSGRVGKKHVEHNSLCAAVLISLIVVCTNMFGVCMQSVKRCGNEKTGQHRDGWD